MPGEAIAGDKITYGFGKVNSSAEAGRSVVSCGFNGTAFVATKWRRRIAEDVPPIANPNQFDELHALSAHGEADDWQETGKASKGSHRVKTGVLRGNATMSVTTPRANVAHKL